MTCDEAKYLLNARLDEELHGALRVEVDSHVRVCGRCAEELENLRRLSEAIRGSLQSSSAPQHLRDRDDAFHVFVYAPFAEKVHRLMKLGKTEKKAIELAETVDTDRSAFIKKQFNVDWPERHVFHLMVNTTIGDEAVVETILSGIAAFEKQPA